MQKTFNFFYAFLLAVLGFGVTLMAEDITLTTYYPAPYGAYVELSTTGNTYLATDSAGNVGIGTTSPARKLVVKGNVLFSGTAEGLNTITILSSDIDVGGGGDGTFGFRHRMNGTGMIQFIRSNDEAIVMSIDFGNKRVGINTPSPAYPLDVVGDINTTGDVRKNGAAYTNPDYVFEPGYKLMGIGELKNYVFENKHLPNMPSTEEIKKDGIKLFEQNKMILEKLEEAYLHIFELEERISKLEFMAQKSKQ